MRYNELQQLGVDVLAASVDSVYCHKVWQESELSKMVQGGVPYPMLSDRGGEIGRSYGVYDENQGVNVRGRFIIDPDGKIVAMEVLTPPVGRNIKETIRQIKAFQTVRKFGVVTPAGWQPGDATIKPSLELAGKVWTVWQATDH